MLKVILTCRIGCHHIVASISRIELKMLQSLVKSLLNKIIVYEWILLDATIETKQHVHIFFSRFVRIVHIRELYCAETFFGKGEGEEWGLQYTPVSFRKATATSSYKKLSRTVVNLAAVGAGRQELEQATNRRG